MDTNTTTKLFHKITVVKPDEKTIIKIRLDDDCGNGHAHFSVTADIYEYRNGRWVDFGGGCCHDHILSLRPDLKPIIDLHLSDQYGVPMHSFANGFYWLAGCYKDGLGENYHGGSGRDGKSPEECRRIFIEHMRITEGEADHLIALMPETAEILQYHCEDMGLIGRWRSDADQAIAMIEQMSGQRWDHSYVPSRLGYKQLSDERRGEIKEMIESGYFSAEAKAERAAKKHAAKMEAKRKEIINSYEEGELKLRNKRDVALEMLRVDMTENFIYYDHSNTISFNWSNLHKLITRDEYEAVKLALDYTKLPASVSLEFREKPRC